MGDNVTLRPVVTLNICHRVFLHHYLTRDVKPSITATSSGHFVEFSLHCFIAMSNQDNALLFSNNWDVFSFVAQVVPHSY